MKGGGKKWCDSRNTVDGLIVKVCVVSMVGAYTHGHLWKRIFQAHRSSWPSCPVSSKSPQSYKKHWNNNKQCQIGSLPKRKKSPLTTSILLYSRETGVWEVQVPFCSWGENGRAHLHAGFATNKPLGVTGKSNEVPLPSHLWKQSSRHNRMKTKNTIYV